jgi:hypothetical protein
MALGTTRLEKLSTALGVTYNMNVVTRKLHNRITYQQPEASLLKEGTEKGSEGRWRKLVG